MPLLLVELHFEQLQTRAERNLVFESFDVLALVGAAELEHEFLSIVIKYCFDLENGQAVGV
jgi:hypothetical protein